MNPIAKMLIDMARFYKFDLAERQLEMYVEVLSQFPIDVVMKAGKSYVLNVKNTRFPVPPHLIVKDYMPQEPDDEARAREAAARIVEAVGKIGWSRGQEAQEYIGELGWSVVQRFGGWVYICENLGVSLQVGQFYAQARDLCKSHIELAKAGELGSPVALPSAQGSDAARGKMLSAGDILKNLLPGPGADARDRQADQVERKP